MSATVVSRTGNVCQHERNNQRWKNDTSLRGRLEGATPLVTRDGLLWDRRGLIIRVREMQKDTTEETGVWKGMRARLS
jgi:hypothetical protein